MSNLNFVYEGIAFNVSWVKTITESQFLEHEKHHFENDVNAVKKLKEVYAFITNKSSKSQ